MRWATTSWTQVLAARGAPTSEARQILEQVDDEVRHFLGAIAPWGPPVS